MNQGSMPVARGDLVLAGAGPQRLVDGGQPAVVRGPAVTEQAPARPRAGPSKPNGPWTLHRPQGLLQGLGEAPADGHRLADALHVRGERGVGAGELLEREPRHLDHHVVQRGLEAGRGLAGDVVRDLVQGVPEGQPGRDLGDREPGGLGGERAATARPAGSSRSRPSGRSRGSTANWMLQPPVSTPTARMIAMAVSRIRWYSRSVSVMAGATVTESPVCTPIGSMFSIEQTTTTLSACVAHQLELELLPAEDALLEQDLGVGLASRPAPAMRRRSASVFAMPEPRPPSVNEGRTTTG